MMRRSLFLETWFKIERNRCEWQKMAKNNDLCDLAKTCDDHRDAILDIRSFPWDHWIASLEKHNAKKNLSQFWRPRRCLRWAWREKKWRISSEGLIPTRVASWISRTGLPGVSRSTIYKKSMKMIWIVIRKSVEFMQLMVFAIVAGVLRIRSKGNQRCQYLSWRNFCARVNRTPYVFPRIFHSKMCCVTKSHGQCFWLRPWTCKI